MWTITEDAPGATVTTNPPLTQDTGGLTTGGTPTAEGLYPLKISRGTAGYTLRYLQLKQMNTVTNNPFTVNY